MTIGPAQNQSRLPWAPLLAISVALNLYQGFFRKGSDADESSQEPIRDLSFLHQELHIAKELRAGDEFHEPAEDLLAGTRPGRLLSEGSGKSGKSGSSTSGHEGPHQHDALLFLFNGIFIGTAMLHVASVVRGVQLTVVLFVIGVVMSLLLEGTKLQQHIGVMGESYAMWMDIDPHMMVFAFLPMLLAGDAMTIDTHVAKRVALQCLYLAGPGVLVSALLVGTFLKFFLNWTFLLSMVTSSILCATDPVAVVALLKELGASPMLTVQIQGESLLNDGTAIVLYTVCYEMLSGKRYDATDMAMFLVRKVMVAMALGVFLGYMFFGWIRLASNRFNHSSSIIQILLTLCAAYWSFCLAEGVFQMSGVLATVGSSIVLAHYMWPHIVSPGALGHFWHTLEELGNIIVFILGGALTGKAMLHIKFIDYINLLVIYFVLLVVRGTLIFASRPLLRILSRDKLPVSVADAAVMTWGGLRGAVGLALAIQVQRGRAADADGLERISATTADRVLFFVSGVAFLTTVVNATTCPALVTWLGITALPEARQKLLKQFNDNLVSRSIGDSYPKEVTECLETMLQEIGHHIETIKKAKTKTRVRHSISHQSWKTMGEVIDECHAWEERYYLWSQEAREHLETLPANGRGLGKVDNLIDIVKGHIADEEICKAVAQLFLSLVVNNYWKLIEVGELTPGSLETDVLFTSVRVGLSPVQPDLVDLDFILQLSGMYHELGPVAVLETVNHGPSSARPSMFAAARPKKGFVCPEAWETGPKVDPKIAESPLGQAVLSAQFNISSAAAIILNTLYVVIEEIVRRDDNDSSPIWISLEAVFTIIFTVEFVLKFAVYRKQYWRDAWNVFDFVLVLLGIFGVIMSAVALRTADAGGATCEGCSSESRVIRVARVLRTLRFLRVFRILNARLSADKYVSPELARQMHKLNCLNAYVHSHLVAQQLILEYMGTSKVDEDDDIAIARCILQSQALVYQALVCTLSVQSKLQDTEMLDELKFTKERKRIVEALEQFVEKAQKDGALTARETEAILHPMHDNISECLALLNARSEGKYEKKVRSLDKGVSYKADSNGGKEAKALSAEGERQPELTGTHNEDQPHHEAVPEGANDGHEVGVEDRDVESGVNDTEQVYEGDPQRTEGPTGSASPREMDASNCNSGLLGKKRHKMNRPTSALPSKDASPRENQFAKTLTHEKVKKRAFKKGKSVTLSPGDPGKEPLVIGSQTAQDLTLLGDLSVNTTP